MKQQLTTVTFSKHIRSNLSSEERNRDTVSFHWKGRDLPPHFSPIGLIMDDSDIDSKESAASSPEQLRGSHPSPPQHRRSVSTGAETQLKSASALLRSSSYSIRKVDDHIGHTLNDQKDTSGQDLIQKANDLLCKTTNDRTTKALRRAVSSEATPERPKVKNFVHGGRSLSFGSLGTEVFQRDSTCAYLSETSPIKKVPSKSVPLSEVKCSSEFRSNTDGVLEHVKVVAGVSEARDDDSYTSNMARLEFEAPRNGQLGLILEAETFSKAGSITVRSVKDYSPLLGLVQPGDKIVEVDHIDTMSCNLEDMARLLTTTQASMIIPSESYQPEHPFSQNLNVSILRSRSDDGSPDLVG
jgi:hypothetical protein